MLAAAAPAQTGTMGNRTEFVFHVYVDPLAGCDEMARQKNPVGQVLGAPNPNLALTRHPHWNVSPYFDPGRIQQAPYAFKTLTAALSYVTTNFYVSQNNNTRGFLPWILRESPIEEYHITSIVIHCLPGIYAPIRAQDPTPPIDPWSGLPYNGEIFPLNQNPPGTPLWRGIPPGTSIQGASALDVIFDGRGREGELNHIFRIAPLPGTPIQPGCTEASYDKTFIDSITIRNVRSAIPESGPTAQRPGGSGIAIMGEGIAARPVISNCIITDCEAGIAIDSDPMFPDNLQHSPIIVNNTIAWNRIGIWSGPMSDYPQYPALIAWARPRVFNNIIDPRDPDNQFQFTRQGISAGTSCFEGLDPTDLTIERRFPPGNPQGIVVDIDFNAYPENAGGLTFYNRGIYPVGWTFLFPPQPPDPPTMTQPRTLSPSYTPRIDLVNFMGFDAVLYINDVFRVSDSPPRPDNKSSRSPHDFRLSPKAKLANTLPIPPSFLINPLVNLGIDTSKGWLQFANFDPLIPNKSPVIVGQWDSSVPLSTYGTPGLFGPGAQNQGYAEDLATLHAWDWDCEGYGNPRIEMRPLFPSPPLDPNQQVHGTYIDLGADEMGTLIMAGYIDGTRIFSRMVPERGKGYPSPTPADANLQVFFFDLDAAPNSYTRPWHNGILGRSFHYNFNPSTPTIPPQQWTWGPGSTWWHYQSSDPIKPNPHLINQPSTFSRFTQGMDTATWSSILHYRSKRRNLVLLSLPSPGLLAYPPFMRSLECDFSPHLIPDIHPGWGALNPGWSMPTFDGNFTDVFSSNPWYHQELPNQTRDSRSSETVNRYLYYNGQDYRILQGTINPPGTWILVDDADPQLGYLRSGPGEQFGPYAGAWRTSYSVDVWGKGDTVGLDEFPEGSLPCDWDGMRFNCQRGAFQPSGSPLSNLQTFLVVNGADYLIPLATRPNMILGTATQADMDRDLARARKFIKIMESKL